MTPDDLRAVPLFDGLSDAQLKELIDAGRVVRIEPGVDLFREGDHADSWWVLLEGALELRRRAGREEDVVGTMDVPGRWAGGFRAWDEDGVYLATGRGKRAGRVLEVPAETLRTLCERWFPFGGHIVRGLYGTARSIEATARQRESVFALGELAAGLAHEINNPAAAAVRAIGGLEETRAGSFEALAGLAAAGLTASSFVDLDALRRDLRPPAEPLGALARSDLEDELAQWLEEHDVPGAWEAAESLASAGADVDWCSRLAAAVPAAALGPALDWVAGSLTTTSLLADARESVGRISGLVSAIRSYFQMDRATVQLIDVTEGLESTVTVFGSRLAGVSVERDYAPGRPEIEAYAGELNQVWTNLLDNALDALDGKGTLRLSVRADGEAVVVEVGDSGIGMPPAVAARAFEAFFTTKPAGQGAGLGLDVARRIVVERHEGEIGIDTSGPLTVLRVRLPVRPARRR